MSDKNAPTIKIGGSGCAAIICVLVVCLTVIIVTGNGPVVWGGIVAAFWWLLKAWLWLVGGVIALAVICVLVVLWLSRK